MLRMQDSVPRALRAKFGSLLIVALMFLAVVFGCRSSSPKCTGEVDYEGRVFTGAGKNTEEAQQFACNKYCLEVDSVVDARYRIWLDSPKGRAAGRPSKQESLYKDKDLLDYVTLTCAPKCVNSVKAGQLKGSTKCS